MESEEQTIVENVERTRIPYFEILPNHVIENMFNFLPLSQVGRICSRVNKRFLFIANRVVKNEFFKLYQETNHELRRLKSEILLIPITNESIERRISILRSIYLCELIISELDLIKVLLRRVLFDGMGNSFSIGKLLEECNMALMQSRRKDLPRWHPGNSVENNMMKSFKSLFEKRFGKFDVTSRFGCEIIDFIDVLLEREYLLDININMETNTCFLDGLYKLDSPRYLNRPPSLEDDDREIPTVYDKKRIIQYIVNFVRINNRTLLREEQYNRETEAAARMSLLNGNLPAQADITDMWMLKQLRDHSEGLNPISCNLQRSNGYHLIKGTFRSLTYDTNNLDKGFMCFVHLECGLDLAPLTVIHTWKEIQSRILDGTFSECQRDNDELRDLISAPSGITSEDEAESLHPRDNYRFGCTIEASIIVGNNLEVSTLTFSEP